MTRYMLDTNTVSYLLKKHPAVARRVVAVPITSLCISAITQGELMFGLARRLDAMALHAAVGEFLRRVDVLAWDAAAANAYGAARVATQGRGRVVAALDLLVGAHALSAQAVLVTNDRAFGHLSGLVIEDWTEESR